jgi:hypothetical protein
LPQEELFYKLIVVDVVNKNINYHRTALHRELCQLANDPILLKRRFRMIAQLAEYESQIYKKIYEFSSSRVDDYELATWRIIDEIHNVTDRSG